MIHPLRGIRQGDPLSPFLFLLCTEGLYGLISKAAVNGDIRGYSLCRNIPRLTHLLFADDSLLFCKATNQECQKILDILDCYAQCSGQQINRRKTTIFFSKSTSEETREHIKQALGVLKKKKYEKYLGLPSLVGESKKVSFNTLRRGCGRKFKCGKKSFYHKPGEKC